MNPYCTANPEFHPDSQLNDSNKGHLINAAELRNRMIATLSAGFREEWNKQDTPFSDIGQLVQATFTAIGVPVPTVEEIEEGQGNARFGASQWVLKLSRSLRGGLFNQLSHECQHVLDVFLAAAYLAYSWRDMRSFPARVIQVAQAHPYEDIDYRIRLQLEDEATRYPLLNANLRAAENNFLALIAARDHQRQNPRVQHTGRSVADVSNAAIENARDKLREINAKYEAISVERDAVETERVLAPDCFRALQLAR